jgi:hypothetical protein
MPKSRKNQSLMHLVSTPFFREGPGLQHPSLTRKLRRHLLTNISIVLEPTALRSQETRAKTIFNSIQIQVLYDIAERTIPPEKS